MSRIRRNLYRLISVLDNSIASKRRSAFLYRDILNEALFHANLRFRDYEQFRDEGDFPERLEAWLNNVKQNRGKGVLLRLLDLILFIDRLQMRSLYIDAFRRIIVPWITEDYFTSYDLLSPEYDHKVRSNLRKYLFYSITESFNFPEFLHVNDLSGIRKPSYFSEDKNKVRMLLPKKKSPYCGLIILEDFVGSGHQAGGILEEIKRYSLAHWRILFVPLIILEKGLRILTINPRISTVSINPTFIIRNKNCIRCDSMVGDPRAFKNIRKLIKATARSVLEPLHSFDDPPKDPFGYKNSGAFLVTCHNTPNNTLPLIHHRSPNWSPLFRRLHHSKDGLR